MKLSKRQLNRNIREVIEQRGVDEDGAVFIGTGNFYVSVQPKGEVYIQHGDGHPDETVFELNAAHIDELIEALEAIKGEL